MDQGEPPILEGLTVDRAVAPNWGLCDVLAIRPTIASIDLAAIRANVCALSLAAQSPILAVVKADGYGHGAAEVALGLEGHPQVFGFAVSLVEELSLLRTAGVTRPIVVMGPISPGGHDEIVAQSAIPMVSDVSDLDLFAAASRRLQRPVTIHLKIDSGMGRMGVLPQHLDRCVPEEGVRIAGLATHFACADTDPIDDPNSQTRRQLKCFGDVISQAVKMGMPVEVIHAANSAAILRFGPDTSFNLVRPGLAIYGTSPHDTSLQPAMQWSSAVAQLRDVSAGTSVSYGGLWTASVPSRLAVVPVGYADGYPRRLTGNAFVLIGGNRCPVVGAICMDVCIVDVTALGDAVAVGDPVVLMGKQQGEFISATELAARAGLIEYEITCGVSKRVPRRYHG